MFFALYIVI